MKTKEMTGWRVDIAILLQAILLFACLAVLVELSCVLTAGAIQLYKINLNSWDGSIGAFVCVMICSCASVYLACRFLPKIEKFSERVVCHF